MNAHEPSPLEEMQRWLRWLSGGALVCFGGFVTACLGLILCAYVCDRIGGGRPSPYLWNLLWCGTFQLAWNEACRLTGGDLQFERGHPIISALNKHAFTKESLDESSYVAMAGFEKDSIHDRISKTIAEKFHGSFKTRFMPD